jgi:hypothetical protein
MTSGASQPNYQAVYSALSPADQSVVDRGVAAHQAQVGAVFRQLNEVISEVERRKRDAQEQRVAKAQEATEKVAETIDAATQWRGNFDGTAINALRSVLRNPQQSPPLFFQEPTVLDEYQPTQDMLKTYQVLGSAIQKVESGDKQLQGSLASALGISGLKQRFRGDATKRSVLQSLDARREEILDNAFKAAQGSDRPFEGLLLNPPRAVTIEHVALYARKPEVAKAAISKNALGRREFAVAEPKFHDLRLEELQGPLVSLARDSTLAGGLARDRLWSDVTDNVLPTFKAAWAASKQSEQLLLEYGDYGVEAERGKSDEVFQKTTWPASMVFLHFTDIGNKVIASGGLKPKSEHGRVRINHDAQAVHFTGTGETEIDYPGYAQHTETSDGRGVFAMTLRDAVEAGLSLRGRIHMADPLAHAEDVYPTDANGGFASVPLDRLSYVPLDYNKGSFPDDLQVFDSLDSMVSNLSSSEGDQEAFFLRLAVDPTKRQVEHTDGLGHDIRRLAPAILAEVDGAVAELTTNRSVAENGMRDRSARRPVTAKELARASWIESEIKAYDRYVRANPNTAHRRMDPNDPANDLALLRKGMEQHVPPANTVSPRVWSSHLGGLGAIAAADFDPPDAKGRVVIKTADLLVVTTDTRNRPCALLAEGKLESGEQKIQSGEMTDYRGPIKPIGGMVDAPWICEREGRTPDTPSSTMLLEAAQEAGLQNLPTAPTEGGSTPGIHFLPEEPMIAFRAAGANRNYGSTIFVPRPERGTIQPAVGSDLDDVKRTHLVPLDQLAVLATGAPEIYIGGARYDVQGSHGQTINALREAFMTEASVVIKSGEHTFDGQLDAVTSDRTRGAPVYER